MSLNSLWFQGFLMRNQLSILLKIACSNTSFFFCYLQDSLSFYSLIMICSDVNIFYPICSSLIFLDVQTNIFHQIKEVLINYLFKYSFAFFFFNFHGYSHGIWKFPGQGLNPTASAAMPVPLTHCARLGIESMPLQSDS